MENNNATTAAPPRVALLRKLHQVAAQVDYVEKRGRNDHHRYNFAQAVDVVRDVRGPLLAAGVIVTPGVRPGSVTHQPYGSKGGLLTTVDLAYTFHDVETGESLTMPWAACGADTGGDKGIYKAYTGGLKYALLSAFLLPTTDDPEHDALAQPAAPEQDRSKDAERPAAPRIPLDRAKVIADLAVSAGLASWGQDEALTMAPVFSAMLASLGRTKIGDLNVDEAEAVEAFIAQEMADAAATETAA